MGIALALTLVVMACGSRDSASPSSATRAGDKSIELVAISYAGDAQIPHRKFLADPFEASHPGVSVRLVPSESEDVVAQIKAARGAPPYDVIPLGEPRQIVAIKEGWIEQTPAAYLANLKDAYPQFVERCKGYGVPETYSLIGLAYNPERVPEPKQWTDLWKAEYRGQIGVTTPASNLGFAFVVLTAKLSGGSERQIEPAWNKLKELEPFVVAPNPTSLAQLFERHEIAIAPLYNNDAALLAGKGLNVRFVQPVPGAIALVSCLNVIRSTAYPALARDFVNRVLAVDYQRQAAQKPWYFGPTNKQVPIPREAAGYLPASAEDVAKLGSIDWDTASAFRGQVTDRFNRSFAR